MDITLASIFQGITVAGLITMIVVGSRFYNSLKKSIIEDTKFKDSVEINRKDVENNKKEIEKLHDRISSFKRDQDIKMKEIIDRVDSDKDSIIKKFDEMDNKLENKFSKLTELIFELFKKQ